MSIAAANVGNLRPKPVSVFAGGPRPASQRPPPLPSMRVPKAAARQPASDVDREWSLRAAETKARIAVAEEREWQAQLLKAKAALAAEEVEWRALRERAAAETRAAEEREWGQLVARAKANTPVAASPVAASPIAWLAPPVKPAPRARPVVVVWP